MLMDSRVRDGVKVKMWKEICAKSFVSLVLDSLGDFSILFMTQVPDI